VAVMVIVSGRDCCGRHGLWPSWSNPASIVSCIAYITDFLILGRVSIAWNLEDETWSIAAFVTSL